MSVVLRQHLRFGLLNCAGVCVSGLVMSKLGGTSCLGGFVANLQR